MLLKRFIVLLLISFSIISCNSGTGNDTGSEKQGYIAKIDTTMTLTQIAKANNIGEPYLRTKLGIRKNVGNSYTISKMADRFRFSIDDLRKIIEDRKNKQELKKLKKAKLDAKKESI